MPSEYRRGRGWLSVWARSCPFGWAVAIRNRSTVRRSQAARHKRLRGDTLGVTRLRGGQITGCARPNHMAALSPELMVQN